MIMVVVIVIVMLHTAMQKLYMKGVKGREEGRHRIV